MLHDSEIYDDVPSLDDQHGDAAVSFRALQEELSFNPSFGEWLDSTGRAPGQVSNEDDAYFEDQCRRDLLRREILRRNINALAQLVCREPPEAA
jgi:hypothetical protein